MKVHAIGFKSQPKLTKAQRVLWNLREEMKLGNILGNHDMYINAHKSFMKEYVAHPKDALTLPPTTRISAPLFSRAGFNMMKVLFKEIFRKRTDEEKELAQKMQEIIQNRRYYF